MSLLRSARGGLPSSAQVVIVGGGPAGATTAWCCARAGLDVVLLDRAFFPRSKPCAEYVSPEGSRILSEMGVLLALEARAASLSGMIVHAPSGAQIHGEFAAAQGFRGFRDRGLGIRREILDTALVSCARAAGVRVFEGVKIDDVTRDAQGTACGVTVRTEQGAHAISASLVIGADGLRSVVSRRLDLARTARWPRRLALVAHYRDVSGMRGVGEMHVHGDGYVGLASVGEGLTNVALVVPTAQARTMAGDPAQFLTSWIASHPVLARRFATATRVTDVQATGPFASRARRPFAPGAALVGDAADFFDPFTGEGIYAALRGAELLAPYAIESVRHTQLGAPRDALHALADYERARNNAFAGKWRVERLIGTAVAFPALMNGAAHVLGQDRVLADLLIGVTGDVVPAGAIVRPRMVLRLAAAVFRSMIRPSRGAPTSSPHSLPHVHRS
ncbi:MAG: NAD(P)/FAD-dependent oxidoreductase [Gemmatimonadaceae bacterium]|nr:NAD(P)/FAD-dependent oxidoreductase [Gemmatimonadaceae bacterium]